MGMDLSNVKSAKLILAQKGRGRRPITIDFGNIDEITVNYKKDYDKDLFIHLMDEIFQVNMVKYGTNYCELYKSTSS